MCCVAWRRPQPRHRRLYSSPYTRTQSAKRFNILSALPHTSVCLCVCVLFTHFAISLRCFHLNGLGITTSRAAFDMYAGCSTRAEDWAAPEHGGPICTLLAAPQGGSHPRRRRAPLTLPATGKQWTQSQVSCSHPPPIPPSPTQHNLMCFYTHKEFIFNLTGQHECLPPTFRCYYMSVCLL